MTTVLFEFADPTPGGEDRPAGVSVRCALLQVEAVGGRVRSTRAFTVPLVSGRASVVLSPTSEDQAWHVSVQGVEGAGERWVAVPDSADPVGFADLVDVDPRSLAIGPDVLPRWETIRRLVDDGLVEMRAGVGEANAVAEDARAEAAAALAHTAWGPGRVDINYPGAVAPRVGSASLVWPWPARIVAVAAAVSSSPQGQGILLDVNVEGTTIYPSPGERLTIPAGGNAAHQVLDVEVPAMARVTVDVDQVGSVQAGRDLVVSLFLGPA